MTTTTKTKSKLLKIIGGGFLLLSFIVQNFLFDYWDKKSERFIDSNRDYSAMSRASLLYLNLYFNTKLDNDTSTEVVKRSYIHMAAIKEAQGQITAISERDMDKKAKIDLMNALMQKAQTVNDYYSFNDYIIYSNQVDNYDPQTVDNWIKEMSNKRDNYRWVFWGHIFWVQ